MRLVRHAARGREAVLTMQATKNMPAITGGVPARRSAKK
jgi:hypothetical protein